MNVLSLRPTVFALVLALLFQLGVAAAAGLPTQSCCGTCDAAAAPADAVPAPHCGDVPAHRHGNGPCPSCGEHGAALAPFILLAAAALPAVTVQTFVVASLPPVLPAPIPDRLERPPRTA